MGPIEIRTLLEELPEELRPEVIDYIEFLKLRYLKRSRKGHFDPDFKWEDELKDLKANYTSVELQHKASEWR